MSKPLTRAAWESLQALRHASALAPSTSRFSTQLQPISSSDKPNHDYGQPASDETEYKGLFDRILPLGPHEAFLSLQLKKVGFSEAQKVTRVSPEETLCFMGSSCAFPTLFLVS